MTAMTTFAVVLAGVFGLVIGSFLNVVVYRVPAGIPLTRESQCPACDEPVRWYQNVPVLSWLALGGRCAHCRTPISARYPLVEAFTGVSFAIVTWSALRAQEWPTWSVLPVVLAYAVLAASTIALALIDLDVRRLPTVIVVPTGIVGLAFFLIACLLDAPWLDLLRAGIGATVLYLAYELMRVVYPKGMGGGDVKLAGVLGLYLGWIGWGALAVGAFGAFVLGGIYAIALLALRRARKGTALAFGPFMIAGAWVGIFFGEQIAAWYLGLFAG